MTERDPGELADQVERELNDLGGQSSDLQDQVQEVSQDWERKKADGQAPGAQPDQGEMGARERGEPVKETSGGEKEEQSPSPEAPPEEAEPSQADTAGARASGPPADSDASEDEDGSGERSSEQRSDAEHENSSEHDDSAEGESDSD